MRGLLVQQTERRNAENLAEAVEGATPRALAALSDQSAVVERGRSSSGCKAILAAELSTAGGVFILDDTGFGKQGQKSVGVARQYSGTLGKVGNCQVAVFLGYASERGHALIDRALYLPHSWTDDAERCQAAGVPEDQRLTRARPIWPSRSCANPPAWPSGWQMGDGRRRLRQSAELSGCAWTPRAGGTCWKCSAPPRCSRSRPDRSAPVGGQRSSAHQDPPGQQVSRGPWPCRLGRPNCQTERLARTDGGGGSPGTTQLPVRKPAGLGTPGWHPGPGLLAGLRRNLDGSELKYYFSNAPTDTPLAHVGKGWRCALDDRDRVSDLQGRSRARRI